LSIVIGIKVRITKFVDYNAYPGWVECRFVDAWGHEQTVIEKVPIVSSQLSDENSKYPQNGHLACEILEERVIETGIITRVTTEKPWCIVSTAGEMIFEVRPEQVETFSSG
jgi:hypothetical protein